MFSIIYLGIDISKNHIDCCFKQGNRYQHIQISNDLVGFNHLINFIKNNGLKIKQIHACCEATNTYYLNFAKFLYANNIKISVVNPTIIKAYADYHLRRVKTDKQDAKLIADFCESAKPDLWQPTPELKAKLISLHRRCNQLNEILVAEKQRLDVADEYSQKSIERIIELVDEELATCRAEMQSVINESAELTHKQKVLESITGIGRTTSQILLPIFVDIDKFANHKKLISYLGLSPIIRKSGKYQGKERVSKMGDNTIRKSLYMPARSACTRSKLWRGWFDRQIARGKHPKQVYVMMMSRIIKYAYYCIKRDEMFDESRHKVV